MDKSNAATLTRRLFTLGLATTTGTFASFPVFARPPKTVRPISVDFIRKTKPHLLAPSGPHLKRVRAFQAEAWRAGRIFVPADTARPAEVSLAHHQTAYRDQEERNTCYAFAACAAIEAAYKRQHAVDLHLSEHYAFHINKCFELYPSYMSGTPAHENNTSFCGFEGASDIIAKLAICALPDAAEAPYQLQAQMERLRKSVVPSWSPTCGTADLGSTQEQYDALEYARDHIPFSARNSARYIVTDYRVLPEDPSLEDVEAVLAAGYEVVADISGHCTLLIGYNRTARQWLVKNSWGEGGPVYWAYDDPNNRILGGTYVLAVGGKDAEPQNDARWLGRWHTTIDGWPRGSLVIRRTLDFHAGAGQPTKLGNYYHNGKRYDVNGSPTDYGQGLHFWIAETSDRVPPGEPRGQEFRIYVMCPLNLDSAAGLNWRDDRPYGVILDRNRRLRLPAPDFHPDAWIGVWNMFHSDSRGTLTMGGTPNAITGVYRSFEGKSSAIDARIHAGIPHVLNLTIDFSSSDRRAFRLACHVGASRIASGTMAWGNRMLGTMMFRTAP